MYIEQYQVNKLKVICFIAGFAIGFIMTESLMRGEVSGAKETAVNALISRDQCIQRYASDCEPQ